MSTEIMAHCQDGDEDTELVTTQRVTLAIMWLVEQREILTTRQVAQRLGITWHGARRMLELISLEAPITQDDLGRWQRM